MRRRPAGVRALPALHRRRRPTTRVKEAAALSSVPLAPGEAAECDQSDQGDDDPDPEVPDDREDDPENDEDSTDADAGHAYLLGELSRCSTPRRVFLLISRAAPQLSALDLELLLAQQPGVAQVAQLLLELLADADAAGRHPFGVRPRDAAPLDEPAVCDDDRDRGEQGDEISAAGLVE